MWSGLQASLLYPGKAKNLHLINASPQDLPESLLMPSTEPVHTIDITALMLSENILLQARYLLKALIPPLLMMTCIHKSLLSLHKLSWLPF